MSDLSPHVLPPSSTALEQELARLTASLDAIDPSVITTIWDADTCPEPLLSWLAWALSVDVWNESWPTDVKRRAIAASPEIHRRKGTRAGIDAALRILNAPATILEWWRQTPRGRRGTAIVTALVSSRLGDDVLLSPDRIRDIRAALDAAKPKSRSIELRIGVGMRATFGVAVVGTGLGALAPAVVATPPKTPVASLGFGVAGRSIAIASLDGEARAMTSPAQRVGMAAACRSVTIYKCRMEAVAA